MCGSEKIVKYFPFSFIFLPFDCFFYNIGDSLEKKIITLHRICKSRGRDLTITDGLAWMRYKMDYGRL